MARPMRLLTRFLLILLFLFPLDGFSDSRNSVQSKPADDTWMIFARAKLEDEGLRYMKKGKYEEALAKFKEENSPELRPPEAAFSGTAILYIQMAYFMLGKYEEALAVLEIAINASPNAESLLRRKKELEAIIEFQKNGSKKPVYDVIQYLKEKYLSPKAYSGYADSVVPAVIRLYDQIQDYDAGVAFADEIRVYGLRKDKKVLKKVESAQEAWQKSQELKGQSSEWLLYKFAYEYLRIREAFLEDKKSGTKGRATQVLIQSDYFPW